MSRGSYIKDIEDIKEREPYDRILGIIEERWEGITQRQIRKEFGYNKEKAKALYKYLSKLCDIGAVQRRKVNGKECIYYVTKEQRGERLRDGQTESLRRTDIDHCWPVVAEDMETVMKMAQSDALSKLWSASLTVYGIPHVVKMPEGWENQVKERRQIACRELENLYRFLVMPLEMVKDYLVEEIEKTQLPKKLRDYFVVLIESAGRVTDPLAYWSYALATTDPARVKESKRSESQFAQWLIENLENYLDQKTIKVCSLLNRFIKGELGKKREKSIFTVFGKFGVSQDLLEQFREFLELLWTQFNPHFVWARWPDNPAMALPKGVLDRPFGEDYVTDVAQVLYQQWYATNLHVLELITDEILERNVPDPKERSVRKEISKRLVEEWGKKGTLTQEEVNEIFERMERTLARVMKRDQ
ncbi:MAG: hypothetical protein E3J35_03785 [Methanomassiliicoccales archaeon]|nr:MAG: hypothetical protein E3J35_03785 [Methanomassiliicoccales archaeon]